MQTEATFFALPLIVCLLKILLEHMVLSREWKASFFADGFFVLLFDEVLKVGHNTTQLFSKRSAHAAYRSCFQYLKEKEAQSKFDFTYTLYVLKGKLSLNCP